MLFTSPAAPRHLHNGIRRVAGWLLAVACLVLIGTAPAARAQSAPAPDWTTRLQTELVQVDARSRAAIGVYVRDLDSGAAVSHHADETWYLASTVKLPVAMAVLQSIERGEHTLQTTLTLREADYVDGAGQTNNHPPGTPLTLRYLIEQMIIHSDNTASDMLIGLVGIQSVNTLVQSLVPHGFQPITSLADVRRHVYGELDPAAMRLSGKDFLLLKQQRTEPERRQTLARLLHVPASGFRLATVNDAYDAYYATGLNSARLDAYGDLLQRLIDGKVLNPANTAWLLKVMERVQTGPQRIKAGLPAYARFAHKTGTQSARTCDSGLIRIPRLGRDRQIIVVACTRGDFSLAGADRALRQVGSAICRSGLFSRGALHEADCPVDARVERDLPVLGAAGER